MAHVLEPIPRVAWLAFVAQLHATWIPRLAGLTGQSCAASLRFAGEGLVGLSRFNLEQGLQETRAAVSAVRC